VGSDYRQHREQVQERDRREECRAEAQRKVAPRAAHTPADGGTVITICCVFYPLEALTLAVN
jgi:hypothetical protein